MRKLWKRAVLPALAILLAVAAQAAEPKEIHQTIPLNRDGHLSIENYKGSITVTTGDTPEIRMGVRIEPDGRASDPDEQEKAALTEVRVSGSGGWVTIKTSYERLRHRHFFSIFGFDNRRLPLVHYTIEMPATARLQIKDYKSAIRVSDLRGDLNLKTYKGTAAVSHLDGAADVKTYKGDVRVEFARFSRASRLETYKGEIDVRLPKDSRFDLETDAGRRGDVDSEFALASRAGRPGSWGRATSAVNGGGPALRLETYKGSLRLRSF
jgi:hypothetical protein